MQEMKWGFVKGENGEVFLKKVENGAVFCKKKWKWGCTWSEVQIVSMWSS